MREGDRLRGRGEALGAVLETGDSGETYEGHVKRYFGGKKGAAARVIWKALTVKGEGEAWEY